MSARRPWTTERTGAEVQQPNPGGGVPPGTVPKPRPEGAMTPMGTATTLRDWHPTVVNLLVLILLELVAYAVLRYVFRAALGS